jgi:hypothetical protein
MSTLPLQEMIQSVLADATSKLASAEESGKAKKLLSYEKKEHGGKLPSIAEEEAEKTASQDLTNPEYIEKLASAVDFIAVNTDSIEPSKTGPLAQALAKVAESVTGSSAGPGKGPGALDVTKAVGGTQSYKKDKPATEDAAASQAGKPLSTGGLPAGSTQLDNNMHKAPGGGGQVPKAKYPEKGPLVNLGKAKTAGAGAVTPAAMAKDIILEKLAGEDVMKSNISAPASANPLAGKGQLRSMQAGETAGSPSGGPTAGFGNQGRSLIASNKAAIDATKGQAKGPQKTQLKEVLDEPALSPKTDTTLKNNLRNTGAAGVKIAAARVLMQKIASGGCTCEKGGEKCQYCLLKEAAIRAGGSSKTANAIMGYGGGAGAAPPMGGSAGGGGAGGAMGGMAAMAQAGASADGCVCGNTGECRVCKLKAALAAAKAGGMVPGMAPAAGAHPAAGMGGAVEKDSMGAMGAC